MNGEVLNILNHNNCVIKGNKHFVFLNSKISEMKEQLLDIEEWK